MRLKMNPITGKLDLVENAAVSGDTSEQNCDCSGIDTAKLDEWIEQADNGSFSLSDELSEISNT